MLIVRTLPAERTGHGPGLDDEVVSLIETPEIGVAVPWAVEIAEGAAIVGASLTAFTVTVNVRLLVLFEIWPSLTVTVMVAAPFPLGLGVNFKVPVLLGLT